MFNFDIVGRVFTEKERNEVQPKGNYLWKGSYVKKENKVEGKGTLNFNYNGKNSGDRKTAAMYDTKGLLCILEQNKDDSSCYTMVDSNSNVAQGNPITYTRKDGKTYKSAMHVPDARYVMWRG